MRQIFQKLPPVSLCKNIIHSYGFDNLANSSWISREDSVRELHYYSFLELIETQLRSYYLPCKQVRFLDNMTPKKSITIIRHLCKVLNLRLTSKEKYTGVRKHIFYKISQTTPKQQPRRIGKEAKTITKQPVEVLFD